MEAKESANSIHSHSSHPSASSDEGPCEATRLELGTSWHAGAADSDDVLELSVKVDEGVLGDARISMGETTSPEREASHEVVDAAIWGNGRTLTSSATCTPSDSEATGALSAV